MKKNILGAIGIVAVIIIIFAINNFSKKSAVSTTQDNTPSTPTDIFATNTSKNSTGSSRFKNPVNSVAHQAWLVLQDYLEAAKNHDIVGIKNLSHQLSSSCQDITSEENKNKCFDLMDNVYQIGITLKESDYINVWSDSKQIILFTDSTKTEDENTLASSVALLYFTVDSKDNPKILGMNPYKEVFVKKGSLSKAEVENNLKLLLKDTDKDGVGDQDENCTSPMSSKDCQKTDPLKRDTDGDGYWDGIEALFYK